MAYLWKCGFLVICFLFSAVCDNFQDTLGHLKPGTTPEIQALAAKGVIERLVPDEASLFNVIINPQLGPVGKDTFQVLKERDNDTVTIIGSSGVAACWGFHHYLKHFCYCHVSWDGDQLALPHPLPDVNITITSVDRFRYYQNVCTTSYSFVWWDWTRWQREIDWMALNGINFALAFTGQEAVWQRIYQRLGLSQGQIDEHFAGPAFLSWSRMGNVRGWGGPLPSTWHNETLLLQHRILDSMRALGIIPILPAFAGHVPRAFKEIYPNASMVKVETWNNFKDKYCCPYLLDPTDPLFRTVGNMFLTELIAEFGTDHAFNCDTFNEMTPHTDNVTYLAAVSTAIFQSMTDVDSKAIWVLQGWLFTSNFWKEPQAHALLTSVPIGRMIVLDLMSELNPQYFRFPSYFGQPFIWCMLHNFGGTLGMYGAAGLVNAGIFTARNLTHSMVGTGLTPEGINQNYVMYDLVNDMSWREKPANLTEWFSSFIQRRYGEYNPSADRAWSILQGSVYNFAFGAGIHDRHVITVRPSLTLQELYWYNTTSLQVVWAEMLDSASLSQNSSLYQHDLVDVTRQCLQVLGSGFYRIIVKAYKSKQTDTFQTYASKFLSLLNDLEVLLASNKAFLLGTWLENAKSRGTTLLEKQQYEYNARNQITLWGPRGEIRDYAVKQWSGVVSHYFIPRWQHFLNSLNSSLIEQTPFNQTQFDEDVFRLVEEPFTLDLSSFPDTPQGDSLNISRTLYDRWNNETKAWRAVKMFESSSVTSGPRVILL